MSVTHRLTPISLTFFTAIILSLSPVFAAPTTLIGYWTFDDGESGTPSFLDHSNYLPGVHNGTLSNTGTYSFQPSTNAKLPGQYLQLSGNAYAIINNSAERDANYQPTFDFAAGEAFSISLWMNSPLPATPSTNEWAAYISKFGENVKHTIDEVEVTVGYGYQLRRHGNTYGSSFTVRNSGTDDGPNPGTSYNIYDEEWHHIVGVSGNGYRELYVDGNLIYRIGVSANAPNSSLNHLVIGACESLDSNFNFSMMNNRYFNAALDDIAMFNGVLSRTQIAELFKGTSADDLKSFALFRASSDTGYNGCGSGVFGIRDLALSSFANPTTVVNSSHGDRNTGTFWGNAFTVNDKDTTLEFEIFGNFAMPLLQTEVEGKYNFTNRRYSGAGFALWNLTANDYVRDATGKIMTVSHIPVEGTTGDARYNTPSIAEMSLAGSNINVGDNLMLMGIDREGTASWAWTALREVCADSDAVTPIGGTHHLVIQDYHFDIAGDLHGWFETDLTGKKTAETVTRFTQGNRGNNVDPASAARSAYYIDNHGLNASGEKGFLSSGSQAGGGEEISTGMIRSPAFSCRATSLSFTSAAVIGLIWLLSW